MSYFNPSKYSTESNMSSSFINESSLLDVSDEIVEKGHKNIIKVDIDKFNNICKKFKEKKDVKIKNLSGQDKEDFDLILSYVHLLYGTSYYSALYEKVKKHFKNIKSAKPGTVGGYFAGCLISSKDNGTINSGCHIGCAGSMPLPKDEEGWNLCDKAVILAEKNSDGYSFSVIKPGNTQEEMDTSYVFVDSTSLNDFTGFSQSEKEDLKALGCSKVNLVGYSSDMTYSEFYPTSKYVQEIKHRKKYSKKRKEEDSSFTTVGVVAIILLIILILICLIYIYNRNKN
jgi:hypothetical protein